MRATGVGSLPGTDAFEAARIVAGELPEFIHLAELPDRGPGADLVGRTAALLDHVTGEFAVDTTPLGWRISGAGGRTMRRAWSWFAEDLDALESTTGGYVGPLKIQVAGPWTLAAGIEARTGHRLIADPGAYRDLAQALSNAVQWLVGDVRRRNSAVEHVFVQFDEPGLGDVAAGSIATASGLSRVDAIQPATLEAALRLCCTGVSDAGAIPGVHARDHNTPWSTVLASGARFLSFDMLRAGPSDEQLGHMWESGIDVFAGTVPASAQEPMDGRVASAPVRLAAERLGLTDSYQPIVITPTAGLAGSAPSWVPDAYGACRAAARILRDEREGHE